MARDCETSRWSSVYAVHIVISTHVLENDTQEAEGEEMLTFPELYIYLTKF